MEYKEPTEDLKPFVERAQAFWEHINVDEMQPIVHGDPIPEDELKRREEEFLKIQEKIKEYESYKKSQQERTG
jgi:hypothetical protein